MKSIALWLNVGARFRPDFKVKRMGFLSIERAGFARIPFWVLGCFLFLCLRAVADPSAPQFPGEATMNATAGRGKFLFVSLRLEDGKALPFIMDTGSSMTILDKSLESKLGKSLGSDVTHIPGNDHAGVFAPPKLYLEGVPLLLDSNVFTLHLDKWLSEGADRPIKGVLGFDCLKHYCIQLDFSAGKIRFLDSCHLQTNQLGKAFPIIVPYPDERPFIHHIGLAGGTGTNCQIDTGMDYDGWVERGTVTSNHLPECHWDGSTYTNLNVAIGDHGDNVLGLTFLARHLVTIDFPNKMLYLKQTSIGPLQNKNNLPPFH